jgi:hypothetical protein
MALAFVLPLLPVTAQESVILRSGDRVRLVSPSYTYVATFVQLDRDSLVVEPDGFGRSVRVSLNTLTRLDIQNGTHWRRAAAVGALIGATMGGVGGVLVTVFGEPQMDLLAVVAITVGSGAGLGAMVGGITAPARWKESGMVMPGTAPMVPGAAVRFRLASLRF